MNKWIGIGRLVRDPELNTTQNGISVCKFTLAVNRPYKAEDGKEQADYLSVVVWRTQAENCHKYLTKGSQCAVVGSIQTRTYEKDGEKKYITEIVADNVEFLSSPQKSAEKPAGRIEDLPEAPIDDSQLPF